MTFDVKQNNWILPIKGEYFMVDSEETLHQMRLREQAMKIKIDWQTADTFNMLNEHWWPAFFNQKNLLQLRAVCRDLDIPWRGLKKPELVRILSEHYRARFQ